MDFGSSPPHGSSVYTRVISVESERYKANPYDELEGAEFYKTLRRGRIQRGA